jgi:uncharacterized protein YaeQ
VLYRFQIDLSDIDRGLYESLDFRVVQHPSEILNFLLTRVLGYTLSYSSDLKFSASGLSDPDTPAMQAANANGAVNQWIEIGNPSARKLHKAGKIAKQVIVYTYKNPEVLLKEIADGDVHRASEIQIYAFPKDLLDLLEKALKKNNHWSIVHQQGQIDITVDQKSLHGEVRFFRPGQE